MKTLRSVFNYFFGPHEKYISPQCKLHPGHTTDGPFGCEECWAEDAVERMRYEDECEDRRKIECIKTALRELEAEKQK